MRKMGGGGRRSVTEQIEEERERWGSMVAVFGVQSILNNTVRASQMCRMVVVVTFSSLARILEEGLILSQRTCCHVSFPP